jgi:type I restriction enzyme R subunit
MLNAIMDALTAHTTMSTQVFNSEKIRNGIRDTLLGPANLYEGLRERAVTQAENKP